jgi:hypothetical protein
VKRNPIEQKIWGLRAAGEAFTKAAAATYEIGEQKIGEAVFYGSLGMLRLCQADEDERGHDVALGILRRVSEEKRSPAELAARASWEGIGL